MSSALFISVASAKTPVSRDRSESARRLGRDRPTDSWRESCPLAAEAPADRLADGSGAAVQAWEREYLLLQAGFRVAPVAVRIDETSTTGPGVWPRPIRTGRRQNTKRTWDPCRFV